MQAIVVNEQSLERDLHWQTVADPVLSETEVLVDIHATAVNRADLLQRSGNYPPPLGAPPYLGLEMAGIVVRAGAQAGDWQPGDRVCALLSGGGYAEQVAVPHQLLLPLPDDRDFTWGAAVPEVFYTAFVNLFLEAGLASGETVLIHGGASGVGTAAIQLACQAGCRVLATAGSAAKLECCRALGAQLAVNYKAEDFAAVIEAHTDGVDVILDMVAGAYLDQNMRLLKSQGRLVLIALLGGAQAPINLAMLLQKRLRLIGSLLRSRPLAEKVEITQGFVERFWPALVAGQINPVIDTILPVTQAQEAQQILSDNRNIGKVILTVR